jgi:hypothetical protein
MLQKIAIEYIIKHGVNGIVILNNRFGDVIKPLICELRGWHFLIAATNSKGDLFYQLIKKYLFL